LRCCNQLAEYCYQRSRMPEPASRHYTSTWYLIVSLKNHKMLSCYSCGLRNDRCPKKTCFACTTRRLTQRTFRCRFSGRPFDESLSRSNIRSTFTSGWIKRIKYALISVPIWTALSLQNPVNTCIQLVPSTQKSRTQVKVLILQHRLFSLSCVSLRKVGLNLLTCA
jgi:hypothetical protein